MKWWRSRYVQHLEAENIELRETIKRMLNPQWRYLLYGETIPAVEQLSKRPDEKQPPQNIKIARPTWKQISSKLEYMVSPQAIIDSKKSQRQAAIQAAEEN